MEFGWATYVLGVMLSLAGGSILGFFICLEAVGKIPPNSGVIEGLRIAREILSSPLPK